MRNTTNERDKSLTIEDDKKESSVSVMKCASFIDSDVTNGDNSISPHDAPNDEETKNCLKSYPTEDDKKEEGQVNVENENSSNAISYIILQSATLEENKIVTNNSSKTTYDKKKQSKDSVKKTAAASDVVGIDEETINCDESSPI